MVNKFTCKNLQVGGKGKKAKLLISSLLLQILACKIGPIERECVWGTGAPPPQKLDPIYRSSKKQLVDHFSFNKFVRNCSSIPMALSKKCLTSNKGGVPRHLRRQKRKTKMSRTSCYKNLRNFLLKMFQKVTKNAFLAFFWNLPAAHLIKPKQGLFNDSGELRKSIWST